MKVELICDSCKGNLEIPKNVERFACGHCGAGWLVNRSGGIINLQLPEENTQQTIDNKNDEKKVKTIVCIKCNMENQYEKQSCDKCSASLKEYCPFCSQLHPTREETCSNTGKNVKSMGKWVLEKTFEDLDYIKLIPFRKSRGWILGSNKIKQILFITNNKGENWEELFDFSEYSLDKIEKIVFVNENFGWLTDKGGNILITEDGGKSWKDKQVPQINYRSEYFTTVDSAFISGVDTFNGVNFVINECPVIFHTVDGERKYNKYYWIFSDNNSSFNKISNYFTGMHFINQNCGWIFGEINCSGHNKDTKKEFSNKNMLTLRTVDGGINWELFCSDYLIKPRDSIKKIVFFDQNHGWIITETGWGGKIELLYTNDSGISWKTQNFSYDFISDFEKKKIRVSKIEDIYFLTENYGFIVGSSSYFKDEVSVKEGIILYTKNKGKTWDIYNFKEENLINSIYFMDESKGWATGDNKLYKYIKPSDEVTESTLIKITVNVDKIEFQSNNLKSLKQEGHCYDETADIAQIFEKENVESILLVDCSICQKKTVFEKVYKQTSRSGDTKYICYECDEKKYEKRDATWSILLIGLFFLAFISVTYFGISSLISHYKNGEDHKTNPVIQSIENEQEFREEGIYYYERGEYNTAIKYYEKALISDPDDADTWALKAYCYFCLKKYEIAIECFEKALDINPDLDDSWYRKGFCYEELGKYDVALKCYEKALEINPGNTYAKNKIETLLKK